jgi:hypothetical protein
MLIRGNLGRMLGPRLQLNNHFESSLRYVRLVAFVTVPEIDERLHRLVRTRGKIIDMRPRAFFATVNPAVCRFAHDLEFCQEHMAKRHIERLPQSLVLDEDAMPPHFASRFDRPKDRVFCYCLRRVRKTFGLYQNGAF